MDKPECVVNKLQCHLAISIHLLELFERMKQINTDI